MRRDMFEVIIERPRVGHAGIPRKGRYAERSERALDRLPKHEGMRPAGRSADRKGLNENLAPLLRFLRKHVGRPWSAVRSEMCAVLSMRSAVQKHVLDHVKHFVEENPVMIDGVPHRPAAEGGRYWPLGSWGRGTRLYVCPRTGLLRLAKPAGRRPLTD